MRPGEQQGGDQLAQALVVDLANQVLEEPFELLDRAVGGGQEVRGVVRAGLEPPDVVELGDQFAAEALDPARDCHRVAGLEPQAEAVDLAEDPRRQRPGPVAELEREIDGAVPGGQSILASAGESALQPLSGAEVRDPGWLGRGRRRRRGGLRGVHAADSAHRPGRVVSALWTT